MTTPKWIIEDFERDNSFGPLAEEVKRQGFECEVIKYEPLQSGSYDVFKDTDCILFQGSINLALQLQRQKPWVPGPWLTAKNYECTTYYAHLGKYLFNDRYIILPRAEVVRKLDWLYNECFGTYEHLFFRPNSGLKPFTAEVKHRLQFDSWWGWVEEFTDPDSLIIISTPKNIKTEYRFICCKGKVLTGCTYEKDQKLNFESGYDDKAKTLAESICQDFQPDPISIVDICKAADDNFYLMEINSFSCGGLYACEMEPIVREASKLALQEWKENQK